MNSTLNLVLLCSPSVLDILKYLSGLMMQQPRLNKQQKRTARVKEADYKTCY
jgi:hypothetical protein